MEREENYQTGYFLLMEDVGIGLDTKICQYLDVDYLLKLLKDNRYYVKRKQYFPDNREKDFPHFLMFPIRPTDKEYKQTSLLSKQQEELHSNIKEYQEQSDLLTSCWTVRTRENILMWDRGSKCKACMQSTIGQFVGSFDKDMKYTIWCGRILYEQFSRVFQWEHKIWTKEPYYSDEEELRFYFSTSINEVLADKPNKENNRGVSLKVESQKMINEIILSPYIDKKTAETMKEFIEGKYKIPTRYSNIDVSNK